jgi:uncharacterized protein YcbX
MIVAELWRYPVKSMAGERLLQVELLPDGIRGDRQVQAYDASGRMVTARTHPGLLGHRAALGPDGEPCVDGRRWDAPEVGRLVEAAAGAGVRLARGGADARFDVLPLLVATDGAIQAFGHDGRRLRPNLVIGGVEGLAEREWEGRRLRAGDCLIAVQELRQRCVMTTFDPDTLEQDVGVLRRIAREFGGALALDCAVLRGGLLSVGDRVELSDP